MSIDFLRQAFQDFADEEFLVGEDLRVSYRELAAELEEATRHLAALGIGRGQVVTLTGDYTPLSVATLLALIEKGAIVAPFAPGNAARNARLADLALADVELLTLEDDAARVNPARSGEARRCSAHPLYETLRERGHPGLVVFSSGSTGEPKGAVHDLVPILEKFRPRRQRLRTIPFLLFDHLGGLNTLLYALANGGCLVPVRSRNPDEVLAAVARHRVELLPTSPSFLNLMLLGEAHRRHDLSSLRIVSYGTEPMPESTLRRLHAEFPEWKLQQTYGLSELGVLRSQSKDSSSLWVRVGGEGFETRVVDGLLEIRSRSAMLGYLNAPSPFTEDGWFRTGDRVEVDGEYLRILGRDSDLVNVGGEKVYPAAVESVLLEQEGVVDAVVHGEKNPILGQVVAARVAVRELPADPAARRRMAAALQRSCAARLHRWQVPVRIELVESLSYQDRFKKERRP